MKDINDNKIEGVAKALTMYRETVSPSRSMLTSILNQIPEKSIKKKEVQAIRSPYIWLAITQAVTVCAILVALVPAISDLYTPSADPFSSTDRQVEAFENQINAEDAAQVLVDYSNNNL